MTRLGMKSYKTILIEATKISASSSAKVDKYEQSTGKETLPPGQCRMIKANFIYSPSGKVLENKTIDAIMNQNKRQQSLIKKNGKCLNHKKYIKNLLEKDLMKYYNQGVYIKYVSGGWGEGWRV